jgi:hypothetical protein
MADGSWSVGEKTCACEVKRYEHVGAAYVLVLLTASVLAVTNGSVCVPSSEGCSRGTRARGAEKGMASAAAASRGAVRWKRIMIVGRVWERRCRVTGAGAGERGWRMMSCERERANLLPFDRLRASSDTGCRLSAHHSHRSALARRSLCGALPCLGVRTPTLPRVSTTSARSEEVRRPWSSALPPRGVARLCAERPTAGKPSALG